MKTINKTFNESWEYLERHHPEKDDRARHIMGGTWLRLVSRPIGIRKKREWTIYFKRLTVVFEVGRRNNWVHLHSGRHGESYLFVPDEFQRRD